LGRGPFFDGRLIFAGEHTCPESYATVHGAYLSGVRAAGQILQCDGPPPPARKTRAD
jgi:hypothetical protein